MDGRDAKWYLVEREDWRPLRWKEALRRIKSGPQLGGRYRRSNRGDRRRCGAVGRSRPNALAVPFPGLGETGRPIRRQDSAIAAVAHDTPVRRIPLRQKGIEYREPGAMITLTANAS